ncbi:MAG: sodium:solute symporter family protein [Egibacteraceae bacterium]
MEATALAMLGAALLYFLVLVGIGRVSARGAATGKEAYFVAGRKLQGLVLFAATFGTNMTAFVMLGLAGQVYRGGLATWAMLLGSSVLILPIHFYFGYRCWLVARRDGITSPAEFYRERYGSEVLGLLVFVFLVLWTLPVVLTGVIGGALVFETFTGGAIPFWMGGLIIAGVVAYYTTAGGMKGTAWTNVLQTLLFLAFLLFALVYVPATAGGAAQLLEQLRAEAPHLPTRVWEGPAGWGPALSFFILFASANFCTPYIWLRMVSAKSGRTLRRMATLYPIAVLVTWGAAVLLALWGAALVPGLEGPAADTVIFALASQLFPTALAALGLLALFAIIMSSMDAQALTISNLFTVDIVQRYTRLGDRAEDQTKVVWWGRGFVLALLAAVWLVSLVPLPAVFDLATFAFTGFMAFFPLMVGGVLWRRATAAGALTSLVVGQIVAIAGFLQWYPFPFGLLPPTWVALASWATFVVVSLLTKPPDHARVERFHGAWDRVWARHIPEGRELEPTA